MRHPSRRIVIAGLIAAATVRRAGAQTLAKLRIGAVPVDAYGEPYYAQEMGFFAKAGLDVEIIPFNNGAGSTTAIAGGALDVGISTVTMMANAAIHGLPLVYIAAGPLWTGTPITALMVGKTSPVTSAKDFVGKTVAVSGIKDGTHLLVWVWLTKNGVDPESVSVIEMPFSSMVPAIKRGAVVAAICAEPFITAGAEDARILALPDEALGKRFMTGGWFTSAAWVQANRPLAKRFAAVIYQTARWANANQLRSGQILAKYAKIDEAFVAKITRAELADTLTPAMIDPWLLWAARAKFTERRVLPAEMIAKL